MKHTNSCKRIISTLLLLCMLLSCVEYTAFASPVAQDGEVVKQGTLVSSENGENKLILRYNRPAGSDKPEPTPSRPQHYDPTPDGSAARSSQTGDDSATWVYILSGASLSLLLLIVIPALSRQNSGGNYKGSRKKK